MLNKTEVPNRGKPAKYSDSTLAWDNQIRLFARYFLAHAKLSESSFSLLDIGCGTGAALREIKKKYPKSNLFGCDVVDLHLQIARERNGDLATFFKSDSFGFSNDYDVIYVSNVLEHIRDWKPAVVELMSHTKHLYILVPFKEKIKPLSPDLPEIDQHVTRFDKKSFQFLKAEDLKIEQRVIRAPYAWGHPLRREIIYRIKAFLLKNNFEIQRELLVSIRCGNCNRSKPFKNRLRVLLEYLKI